MSLSERDKFLVETLTRYSFYQNIKDKGVIDEGSFKELLSTTLSNEQIEIIQYFLKEHAQHVQETSEFVSGLPKQK